MSSFALRLELCGVGKSIKAAELARRCDVSAATVSDWVNDKTSVENLKALPLLKAAAYLEVNPMWLLTGKGSRNPTGSTVLEVQEPKSNYDASGRWPFERVPPEKYYALPNEIRVGVQMMIDGVLLGATFPGSPTPGTGTHG